MATTFANRLLTWFDQHGRKHLPWQQNITPYRVWVSEIMLQQTQVTTVIPYFERFMKYFPSVDVLANAKQDVVLHLWTGLGYYARGRNLHKTAKLVQEKYHGRFPNNQTELEALPGIGRSTAGAILAIAYQQPATILDGNVKRVLARYFAIAGWPGETKTAKHLWQLATELTPSYRLADYTQAMMDLGATVCVRTRPACELCPINTGCAAYQQHQVMQYPVKKLQRQLPQKATCMLIIENPTGEWLLEQRPPSGLWGGLWSFPECSLETLDITLDNLGIKAIQKITLPPFRHTFTHFHLHITPIHIMTAPTVDQVNSPGKLWYMLAARPEIGLTRPVTKMLNQLRFL